MQNSIALDRLERNTKTEERLHTGNKHAAEFVFYRMMDGWKPLDDTDPTAYDQLHCLTNTYAFMNAFTPALKNLAQEAQNKRQTAAEENLRKLLTDIESPVRVCATSYHDPFLLQTRNYKVVFSLHFSGRSTNVKRNHTFGASCWSRRVIEGVALQASKLPVGGSVTRPLTSV
jgi:hypothetical protein